MFLKLQNLISSKTKQFVEWVCNILPSIYDCFK